MRWRTDRRWWFGGIENIKIFYIRRRLADATRVFGPPPTHDMHLANIIYTTSILREIEQRFLWFSPALQKAIKLFLTNISLFCPPLPEHRNKHNSMMS
jgi:hypothetical protein